MRKKTRILNTNPDLAYIKSEARLKSLADSREKRGLTYII